MSHKPLDAISRLGLREPGDEHGTRDCETVIVPMQDGLETAGNTLPFTWEQGCTSMSMQPTVQDWETVIPGRRAHEGVLQVEEDGPRCVHEDMFGEPLW